MDDKCFKKFCYRKPAGEVPYDDGILPKQKLTFCKKHREEVTKFAQERNQHGKSCNH